MQLVLLFLAIIPVVVILTYIYRKDKNKEPGGLLVLLFLMGIASCFMVLGISDLVYMIFPFMANGTEHMTFFEVMAYAFIGVSLVEEFCKFFMSYLFSYKNKAYDEVYDGIVYAVFVSLGFAFFENLLYVFNNQSVTVGIARGILAVPGHACDAVFMGYYLSVAKVYSYQGKRDLERKNLILSVLAPTILHGIYDFCLFTGQGIFIVLFLVFVVFLYIGAIKKIKQLAGKNQPKDQKPTLNQNINNNQQIKSNQDYQNNLSQQGFTPQAIPFPPNVNQTPLGSSNNGGYIQTTNRDYTQNNIQPAPDLEYVQSNNQSAGYVGSTFPPSVSYCHNCGALVTGEYCSKCGSKQS